MSLSTPQRRFLSRDAPWTGPLLVSMAAHALLAWTALAWWQQTFRAVPRRTEVMAVEVVTRSAPVETVTGQRQADPPRTKSPPPAPAPTRRNSVSPAPVRPPDTAAPANPKPPASRPAPRPQPSRPTQQVAQKPAAPSATEVPQHPPAGTSVQPFSPVLAADREPPAARGAVPTEDHAGSAERSPADDVLQDFQRQLKRLIEQQKRYPLMARKGRQQGQTRIAFRLAADGALVAAEVVRSSGHRLLDRAALRAVRAVGRFPAPPAALPPTTHFQVDISFTLE